jgi:hypothetical protein
MPSNTNPLIGRNAVIQMGGVTIGFAQGMTTDINADLIKEFQLGSDKAAILASGNKHFKISCDMMYIDNTYASQVLSGTPVDFIIAPGGTTNTGYPKTTVKNVVLTVFSFKADQKGIVTGKVSGEGSDWQAGTF